MRWKNPEAAYLKRLWVKHSASICATRLGKRFRRPFTRNMVIGKASRMNLPVRNRSDRISTGYLRWYHSPNGMMKRLAINMSYFDVNKLSKANVEVGTAFIILQRAIIEYTEHGDRVMGKRRKK